MATFKGNVKVIVDSLLSSSLDIGTGRHAVLYEDDTAFTNGTGANQANEMFTDQRTIAASSNEELDLAGSLTNAFGDTITFTSVKAIIVKAAAGNTNDVQVGGAASNGFASFLGDASDIVVLKPGSVFCITNPNATGYAVTASTGDLLKIANSSSGSTVTYDIIIIGEV